MSTKEPRQLTLIDGVQVTEITRPEPPENPVLAELITADNYKDLPPLRWFVPGWIIEAGTTAIYGEAGAGKSFWTLCLALEAARGGQWCDHQFAEPKRVLYLAPEASSSHVERIKGWTHLNGTEWPATFHLAPTQVNVYTDESVSQIENAIDALGPIDLLVLDTLASATAGLDENSPNMNVVTQNLEKIRRKLSPGAPLIIVHHTGKDSAKGLRGHSSLLGYVSGSMLITKENAKHKVDAKKVRDGDTPLPLYYQIRPVELPPLPGELVTREVGVMQSITHLEAVNDTTTKAYTALRDELRPNDTFTTAHVARLLDVSDTTANKALKRGADLGLWERQGATKGAHWRYIGRPGDHVALTGDDNALEL